MQMFLLLMTVDVTILISRFILPGSGQQYRIFRLFSAQVYNMKAQLTQGLRATAPSFQGGRQPPSWILSNRK